VLVGLAVLHDAYGELPLVKAVLGGVACAAAGMIIGTALKMTVKLGLAARRRGRAGGGRGILAAAAAPAGGGAGPRTLRDLGGLVDGAAAGRGMSIVLWQLFTGFAALSLIAIGGGIAVVPEMNRLAVDVHGWMSDAHFAQLFALAQAAPGPNIIVVGLIGWHVAGLAGMVVAMLAATGPSGLLAYAFTALPPPPGRPRLAADGGAGAGAGRGRADPGLRSHPGRGGGADGARGGDRGGVHPLRLADEPQPALGAGGGRGAGARCSCEARLFPGRGRSI
jgi:chromate transport protein ChrA